MNGQDTVLVVSLAHFTQFGKHIESFEKISVSRLTEKKMLALFYSVIEVLQSVLNQKVYPSYYGKFLMHGMIQNTLFIESLQIYEDPNALQHREENYQNGQDEISTMEKPKKSFYVYRIVFIPNEYSEHELVMALKEKKASHTNNLIKVTLDPQSHSLHIKEYTHHQSKQRKIWDFMKEIESFPEHYRIEEFFTLLVMWMSVPRHISKHAQMKQNFKKMVEKHKKVYDFKKFKWHTTLAMIHRRPQATKIHPIFFNDLVLQHIWKMGSHF